MADIIRDIDTVVIVLMENRSFDHILGYLGLPPFDWAIEGQQRCNDPRYANPYQGQSYLPFQMSRLDMPHDPPHERPWIANQIGDIINNQRNMTGFVQSYYMNGQLPGPGAACSPRSWDISPGPGPGHRFFRPQLCGLRPLVLLHSRKHATQSPYGHERLYAYRLQCRCIEGSVSRLRLA